MKTLIMATGIMSSLMPLNASAALLERLGGLAYYDPVANLTWLADANYAMTSGYDADGLMNWDDANTWVAGLDIDGKAGADGWRLPDTLVPDSSCGNGAPLSYNYYCTGSEMGNMFYNVLGGVAGGQISAFHNNNYLLFTNIQDNGYWSAEPGAQSNFYYIFNFSNGWQAPQSDNSYDFYAWAVTSGDIGAVPVPAAVWLFGSGLLGLVGAARRKKAA